MNRTLHVAAAQIHSGGTRDENLARAEKQMRAAALCGAEAIVFAEGAMSGYDYDMTAEMVHRLAETVDGPGCSRVRDLARELNLLVMMGFYEQDGDRYYNSHLLAFPDGRMDTVRKVKLTALERNADLSSGLAKRKVFEFKGIRCALIICADNSIEALREDLVQQQVDHVFWPAGGGGKVDDMLTEDELASEEGQKRYQKNRPRVFRAEPILGEGGDLPCSFTSCNALGPVGERTCHQGHCTIVDRYRVVRAQIPGTNVLEHMQDQMIQCRLSFC